MEDLLRYLVCSVFAIFICEDVFFRRKGWTSTRKKRRRHKVWVREWIRRKGYQDNNTQFKLSKELLETNDRKEFQSMLRMDNDNYEYLLRLITPEIQRQDTTFRCCIKPDERLCLTLDYLANGGSNKTLSRHYRVGRCTVGRIINSTCTAIYNALKGEYLKTPTDPETWYDTSRIFEYRWNFPHCLGGLDGKHFRIYPPSNSGSRYFNYKGSFSLVLMALVNANYEFVYINLGCEGRVADGGVWKDCNMRESIENGNVQFPSAAYLTGTDLKLPYVIVADDAFPLSHYLMKPFSGRNLTLRQQIFNYRLSRARRIVENAFGILCNRFRVLLGTLYRTPECVEQIILASIVLHNYLRKKSGMNYIVLNDVDHEDEEYKVIRGTWRNEKQANDVAPTHLGNFKNESKSIRDAFADYFISEVGEITWQYKRAYDSTKNN